MSTPIQFLISKIKGDRYIWLVVFVLSVFSILAVYSSTGTLAYKYQEGNTEYYVIKHTTILLFGIFLMYLSHLIPFKYYSRIAQILLWISVPMLLYTLLFGSNLNEASRWITLPVINLTFQTSTLHDLHLLCIRRELSRRSRKK